MIRRLIRYYIGEHPELSFKELLKKLNQDFESLARETTSEVKTVSAAYLSQLTNSMNLSWRIPITVQRRKFTAENIRYTTQFMNFIQQVPYDKIKFMDESHFVAKGSLSYLLSLLSHEKNSHSSLRIK